MNMTMNRMLAALLLLCVLSACGGGSVCDDGKPVFESKQQEWDEQCEVKGAHP